MNIWWSSGKVSASIDTLGGLYGCIMLTGRETGREEARGCGGGESPEGPATCASEIDVNVSRRNLPPSFFFVSGSVGGDFDESRFEREADHAADAVL